MEKILPQDIIPELYENYYTNDQTPSELVSSHWKNLHQNARVKLDDHHLQSLKGVGFGDLQHSSLSYRCFSWLTNFTYTILLRDKAPSAALLKSARYVCRRMGVYFTYDCFRQVCSLSLIKDKIQAQKLKDILCIGDGYGFMASLIKEVFPQTRVYLVDLGKTLLFQSYYCQKVHPHCRHSLVRGGEGSYDSAADFIYCPAENIKKLTSEQFDLAVNIASMQEMNNVTIAQYFNFLRERMREQSLFYCCNRLEKRMSDSEVTRIREYPWVEEDAHIVDELCPWYRFFLAGYQSLMGPKIGGIRIPFVNYFDGLIWHRLTILKTYLKE